MIITLHNTIIVGVYLV